MNEKDTWQDSINNQKRQADTYLENVERLEPNLATIWGQNDCAQSSQATALISIAMSLKRIADHCAGAHWPKEILAHTEHGGIVSFYRQNNTNEYRDGKTETRIYL